MLIWMITGVQVEFLNEIMDKDVMLWNMLILGYMMFGRPSEVQGLFVKAEQGGVRGFV